MICLFLLPFLGAVGKAGPVLIILAVGSALASAFLALESRRVRSKYDLRLLQKIHEQKEVEEIDPGEVSELPERIMCPRCGHDYSTRFPACPNCGRAF